MTKPGVLRGGIVRNIVIAADTGAADAQVQQNKIFFKKKRNIVIAADTSAADAQVLETHI